eukprot:766848-Hanusia_phi.AAC.2
MALLELANALEQHGLGRNLNNFDFAGGSKHSARGSIASVINQMKQCPNDAEMQDELIAMLSGYALNPSNNLTIVECGGIEAVITAMKKHKGEVMLVMSCLGILQNLATNVQNATRIRKAGGVGAAMSIVKKHESFDAIPAIGAFLFHTLAHDDECFRILAQVGALEAVAKGMKQHQTFSEMQVQGTLALRAFAAGDKTLHAKIFKQKGVTLVFDILDNHSDDKGAISTALEFLNFFAWECSLEDRPKYDEQANVKALSKLIKANHQEFLVDATELMRLLAYDSPDKVVRDGGIDAVLFAMKKNRTDERLMVIGCNVLTNVIREDVSPPEGIMSRKSQIIELMSQATRDFGETSIVTSFARLVLKKFEA